MHAAKPGRKHRSIKKRQDCFWMADLLLIIVPIPFFFFFFFLALSFLFELVSRNTYAFSRTGLRLVHVCTLNTPLGLSRPCGRVGYICIPYSILDLTIMRIMYHYQAHIRAFYNQAVAVVSNSCVAPYMHIYTVR